MARGSGLKCPTPFILKKKKGTDYRGTKYWGTHQWRESKNKGGATQALMKI